jgi:hypothetical protein
MQARKLDLADYPLNHIVIPGGGHPQYDVRGSLSALCFVPELQLNGTALMQMQEIAKAILDCPDQSILLNEQDWQKLKRACEVHVGFTRAEVELVRRVIEAVAVEVQEAKQEIQT